MNEFLRFWGLVILVATILVAITIFLMKKFKKHTVAKFIPTLVMWFVSIAFLTMSIFFAEPMQDLGYLIMSMITGIATFITLVITIVIAKYKDHKKKK